MTEDMYHINRLDVRINALQIRVMELESLSGNRTNPELIQAKSRLVEYEHTIHDLQNKVKEFQHNPNPAPAPAPTPTPDEDYQTVIMKIVGLENTIKQLRKELVSVNNSRNISNKIAEGWRVKYTELVYDIRKRLHV